MGDGVHNRRRRLPTTRCDAARESGAERPFQRSEGGTQSRVLDGSESGAWRTPKLVADGRWRGRVNSRTDQPHGLRRAGEECAENPWAAARRVDAEGLDGHEAHARDPPFFGASPRPGSTDDANCEVSGRLIRSNVPGCETDVVAGLKAAFVDRGDIEGVQVLTESPTEWDERSLHDPY